MTAHKRASGHVFEDIIVKEHAEPACESAGRPLSPSPRRRPVRVARDKKTEDEVKSRTGTALFRHVVRTA